MSTTTMKAIRLHAFGGPEVLRYEDVPIPQLKPGEVLVRVHSVGINPPDWYLREGFTILPPAWRPPVPLPIIPGTDVSGVVEAVAADVHGFSVGDEVFGMISLPQPRGRRCLCRVRICGCVGLGTQAGWHRSRARGGSANGGTYRLAVPDRART